MKYRTKPKKPSQTIQNKPRGNSQLKSKFKKTHHSLTKKEQIQTQSKLHMSLQLLQTRFKLSSKIPTLNSTNILQLSSILYKTIKQNIPPKNYQHIISNLEPKSSRKQMGSNSKENQLASEVFNSCVGQNQNALITMNSFNNSNSDLQSVHYVKQVFPQKQRKNSQSQSILDYFKEKFGSPAKDEKQAQKKLDKIKVLKRTQQFINKYTSQSGRVNGHQENSKSLITESIKQKSRYKVGR